MKILSKRQSNPSGLRRPLIRRLTAFTAFMVLSVLTPFPTLASDWRLAAPGYQFHFPADHGPHRDYQTEWWYLTGNLQTTDGKAFGYELTFFRYGYRSPSQRGPVKSRFVMDDLKFAHFTVTDVSARQFHVAGRSSRGAFGDAGFLSGSRLVWIDDWELDFTDQHFAAKASNGDTSISFELKPEKQPVLEGDNGYSRKAETGNHASEYYSVTRLQTRGTLTVGGQTYQVSGLSWFDREWSTNQLAPDQTGWNWFAIQLDNGSDLMLYQIRRRDGSIDPCSGGKWVESDGRTVELGSDDLVLQPIRTWTTVDGKATYPIGWRATVPKLNFTCSITTPVDNQELNVGVRYWEGCIRIQGTKDQKPVAGKGYLELTGYAGTSRSEQEQPAKP
ncbi:MAG: carotenoid 1,2-hydratase [Verrucomicrobia bacterium]|nr:carotenoid 1,2-hydratase [Verrucomicrobiota bacterium]